MTAFLSDINLSLYTIPTAWLLAFAPHIYAIIAYSLWIGQRATDKPASKTAPGDHRFDKSRPRTFTATFEANPVLSLEQEAKLSRAEAAHSNGFANLGFFAGAVVAANIALLGQAAPSAKGLQMRETVWWVNLYALGYVGSRTVYNTAYITGATGTKRGGCYYASMICAIALYVRAGNSLRHLSADT